MIMRIRHIFRVSLVVAMFVVWLLNGSCTQNDGHIGPVFGQWRMTETTIGTEPVHAYAGNVFWLFQNNVVCLREVLPHHDVDNRWGSWKWGEKDVLILDFSHGDELHSPDDKVYEPLVITGFVAGENVLRVHQLTSSHMELSMGNRTYTLKKQ